MATAGVAGDRADGAGVISRRAAIGGGVGIAALAGMAPPPPVRRTREVLTFYYPWYANPVTSGRWLHWQGPNGEAPRQSPTVHHPSLGLYDSHDPAIAKAHAALMRRAGITAAVISWFGPDSFEDQALPTLLDALHAQGIKATVYLERQPDGAAGATRDIAYLTRRYLSHPAWLHTDGRPVFFLYLQALRDMDARAWRAAAGPRPFLVGDVSPREPPDFAAWAPFMDGIHVYVLAPYLMRLREVPEMVAWADRTYPAWKRMIAPRLWCATVIPGFDDTHVPGRATTPRPTVARHDGATYRALWDAAIRHGADWAVVTSSNEWHEASEIEPSREYGDRYIALTADAAARFRRS